MATNTDTDKKILRDLIQMKPETIQRVFFRMASNYRRSMDESIKDRWQVNNEDNTILILSFLQYLTNNDCKVLRTMYQNLLDYENEERSNRSQRDSQSEVLTFHQLLVTHLEWFLSGHQKYKDQRQALYKTLFADTVPPEPGSLLKLKKKDDIIDYILGKNRQRYDSEIQKMTELLKSHYTLPPSFNAQFVKEELSKALCIHPEMVLFSYDFSDTLDHWRDETARRIIEQICDLQIIKCLENQESVVIEKVFYSTDKKYQDGIEKGIRASWQLSETENIFAVMRTFIYNLLIRGKKSELKQLKKGIARKVPYFPLPVVTSTPSPEVWERYEDGGLLTLLQEHAKRYADKRTKYKDERIALQELFNLTEEERNSLWPDYEEQIDKMINETRTNYKKPITDDIKNAIKCGLKLSLCDDLEGTFARYDFEQIFSQWKNTFSKNFIEDYIKFKCMSMDNGTWMYLILEKDHKQFIGKIANELKIPDAKNVVNDIVHDLYIQLFENDMKVLKEFQFHARLNTYINNKIKNDRIRNEIKSQKKEPITIIEDEPVEDPILRKEAIKVWQDEEDAEILIYPEEKMAILSALIKILRETKHRICIGIGPKSISKAQERRLQIFEILHLNKLSSSKKTEERKNLIESYNEGLLRKDEERTKEMIKKAYEKVVEIRKKRDQGCKLSPEEKALLNDFQELLKNIF